MSDDKKPELPEGSMHELTRGDLSRAVRDLQSSPFPGERGPQTLPSEDVVREVFDGARPVRREGVGGSPDLPDDEFVATYQGLHIRLIRTDCGVGYVTTREPTLDDAVGRVQVVGPHLRDPDTDGLPPDWYVVTDAHRGIIGAFPEGGTACRFRLAEINRIRNAAWLKSTAF